MILTNAACRVYTDVGFWRLDQLINDARLRHVEIIPVRIDDVANCYSTLREMDARTDPRANKYIVLDVSGDDALSRILKQVRARARAAPRPLALIIRSFVWLGPASRSGRGQRRAARTN